MSCVSNCPCTYRSCTRWGKCCECVAYHKDKRQLPACYFSEEAEKTYDRSVENYIRTTK
jgi:hypothetical protein